MARKVPDSTRSVIHGLVDTFLDEGRDLAPGAWPHVAEGALGRLHKIIGHLIDARWARDPGGDAPIQVLLVDRTRQYLMHFVAEPHDDKASLADRLRIAGMNLGIAQNQMERLIREVEQTLREGLAPEAQELAAGGRVRGLPEPLEPDATDLFHAGHKSLPACPHCGRHPLTMCTINRATDIFGCDVACDAVHCGAFVHSNGRSRDEARQSAIDKWSRRATGAGSDAAGQASSTKGTHS